MSVPRALAWQEYACLQAARAPKNGGDAKGGNRALVANRLSYHLNLRGPSVTVDTASSSSLVAIHSAVTDLRLGRCSVSIGGSW